MQVIKRSALQYFASLNWKCLLSEQVVIPIEGEEKNIHHPGQQHAQDPFQYRTHVCDALIVHDILDESTGSDSLEVLRGENSSRSLSIQNMSRPDQTFP